MGTKKYTEERIWKSLGETLIPRYIATRIKEFTEKQIDFPKWSMTEFRKSLKSFPRMSVLKQKYKRDSTIEINFVETDNLYGL